MFAVHQPWKQIAKLAPAKLAGIRAVIMGRWCRKTGLLTLQRPSHPFYHNSSLLKPRISSALAPSVLSAVWPVKFTSMFKFGTSQIFHMQKDHHLQLLENEKPHTFTITSTTSFSYLLIRPPTPTQGIWTLACEAQGWEGKQTKKNTNRGKHMIKYN